MFTNRPVVLKDFTIILKDRKILDSVCFEPEVGSSNVIVGKTGVGKSVLLRTIAGFIPLSIFRLDGTMHIHDLPAYIDGKKTDADTWSEIMSRGVIFVPAESAQVMNPALTLEHNCNLLAPESRDIIVSRLKKYFNLDFDAFSRLYPDEVSGGELQRITLMILLSRIGNLFLLDEPTVNLDRNLRTLFAEFLNNEILSDKNNTVLIASHDLDFIHLLNVDKAYALEDSKLKKLEKLPETEGFEKITLSGAKASGLLLSKVSQTYFKRGIFGEREFVAYKNLNVSFNKSTIYGITGPSGCGKSSMIKGILRLIGGTKGAILLDEQDLISLKPDEYGWDPKNFLAFRKRMAVVQQDSRYAFFPDLKIRESIKQISEAMAGSDHLNEESMLFYMEKVGLKPLHYDAYPYSLSSGEMKRIDIARALASKPEVLLLDEPFAHIDFATRMMVMKVIGEYITQNETIIIVVTHEDFDLRYFVETSFDFPDIISHVAFR
ncbi:ATP-binding cassette domain-containing protein [Spirochaetia bacterium 38H-sp]|uniref:ATP-binding cassette domain-containing protein n=1 Tax=Rarispira pelagica TaxID=3141764 RepID=A0ABU9UB83_9SPIR